MKIAVVGIGYVGLVAAGCFAEVGNHVTCIDNDKKKIKALKNGHIPIYEPGLTDIVKRNIETGRLVFDTDLSRAVKDCLVIFLAVGTPSAADGSADISAVLDVAGKIAELMKEYRIIATKSTVPVGTCEVVCDIIRQKTDVEFDYVSNPEFLKEGDAVDDFLKPDRVIVGSTSKKVTDIMQQLYAPMMMKNSRIIFTDPASAEMAKYASNVMLAMRISFMNELSALCDNFGADIEMVRRCVGSDSRIGNAFLFPGIGYGGSCFPKDVSALIHMGQTNDCSVTIARSVQQANIDQQERFVRRIIDYFGSSKDITLAVWGLAFKAGTDDTRQSPAINCIKKLLDAGFKVTAFDPQAVSPCDIKIARAADNYTCLDNADAMVIMTDWKQFRAPDFDQIKKRLKNPVIFDGRNLYDPKVVRDYGIEYHSIGRP